MAGFPPSARVASISVDLDPLERYFRIHALDGQPPEGSRFAILAPLSAALSRPVCAPWRAGDLLRDGAGPRRALLADLARDGHELANHSYSHPYDLVRLGPEAIAREIDRSHQTIASCAGGARLAFGRRGTRCRPTSSTC